jgi:hypothetical protein
MAGGAAEDEEEEDNFDVLQKYRSRLPRLCIS